MKKLYSFFIILAVVLLPTIVLAEGNVAEVNGNEYATIEEAMTAAEGTDYEVKLLQDVTLAQTKVVNEDLTINLNNHTISYTNLLFEVYGAEFTVKGTGTLKETVPYYAPIAVYGSTESTATKFSIVNVESGVTLQGWSGIMVRQYNNYSGKTMNSNAAYGVEVNMAGKVKTVADATGYLGYGLYINGSITDSTNAPVINVADTTEITAVGLGIYIAGYGVLNVEGGTITGITGIEMRAGELYVKGGTITATADELTVKADGSGATTFGAGIAVAQHNTKLPVKVEISGGKISGYVAFNEANPQQNAATDVEKINLSITGGTYTTSNTETDAVVVSSETQDAFVKGGTYSIDVKDYVATGLVSKKVGDVYVVATERTVNIGKVSGGEAKVDVTKAVVGETVTITLTPNEGYLLGTLKVLDANNKEVTVTDNKFVMPDSNVTVSAEFIKTTLTTEIPVVSETNEVGVKDAAKVEDVLLETLGASTDEKVKEAVKDTNVKVEVEIEDVVASDSVTTDFEKALADEKLNSAKVVNYFDITVAVKNANTGEEITTLPELTKAIELMVAVPELEEVKEGYTRVYYIIREHDGKVEVIKDVTLSEDGKYLVFESSEFSTYALAYNDVLATNTPETGDNILYFVGLGFMSIAALGLAFNNLKKRANR